MMSLRLVAGTVRRQAARGFATRRRTDHPIAPEVLEALPHYEDAPDLEPANPDAFPNNPITSAHCVDLEKKQVSLLDSVAVSPDGSTVHGRYGNLADLRDVAAIPLEYLALLRPAAEGAAALRVLDAKAPSTVLVYGASQASGLAATQMASAAGHAVVAVIDGSHSWSETMQECVKGLVAEPGTAVPEEYALSKKLFADLVQDISKGDEGIEALDPKTYLQQFKQNFIAYSEAYPDTRPAAVSAKHMEFEFMEKDREQFQDNMAAFLEQYPPGAPPVDKAKLDASFNTDQYEIFRKKFWDQTSRVISGDDTPFSAPHIVQQQCEAPETLGNRTHTGVGPYFPYSFSILDQTLPPETETSIGGPIAGAVIVVTPELQKTAELVATGKTRRAKAEALQFLSRNQKAAFQAACSVASVAKKANAKVITVGGSLPGLQMVEATDVDVKEALSAMDVDDDGKTHLNYFVQAYRANDFPFYADYAIHRASEPQAGPRQIIVTK